MIETLTETATVGELVRGYVSDEERRELTCLICGQSYKRHYIYSFGDSMVEASEAIELHVEERHGSAFDALIALDKKLTGITENQRRMLQLFREERTDKEIQEALDTVSLSTIRNYRFSLKEKQRQAKYFLAIMESVAQGGRDSREGFISIPGVRLQEDDRFAITEEEYRETVTRFFPEGEGGRLSRLPKKQKQKIAVLTRIMEHFEAGRNYAQNEVNRILQEVHSDYVTLRRYLVDYGFLNRKPDGSAYWVRREAKAAKMGRDEPK